MQREPGFYWVKPASGIGVALVAEWLGDRWLIPGERWAKRVSDFKIIGDRITPPEEK